VTFFVIPIRWAWRIFHPITRDFRNHKDISRLRHLLWALKKPVFGTLRAGKKLGYTKMKLSAKISIMDVMMLIAVLLILSAIILPRFSR
jgi:hypothetical protein